MKRRNSGICNLKAFLLLCVVMGHALERDIGYDSAAAVLYRLLYLFHMPLFAFLSGLGARDGRTCFRQARQAGRQYVWAQGLVLLVSLLIRPDSFSAYLIRPYWHLWYLASLAAWQLLAGCVYLAMAHTGAGTAAHIKGWLLLPAVAAGLAAGCIPAIGRAFSLSRTLVFFPFFLAGAFWGERMMNWISRAFWLFLPALAMVAGGFFYTAKLPVAFLYQAEGYSSFGLDGLSGIGARSVCYITAAACSLPVLILCPKRKCAWTQWGGNTLMPYLLHPVFIGCLAFIPYAPRYAVPVSFVLALTALFCIYMCFKWRDRLFLYINAEVTYSGDSRGAAAGELPCRITGCPGTAADPCSGGQFFLFLPDEQIKNSAQKVPAQPGILEKI